ncbi:hypothetical protein GGR55DRAFT_690521 [Xylaria sp. FL0064]|nr:hypothetical protein GGR55DRAFT_690521 [Xylaria sp. FL0064]
MTGVDRLAPDSDANETDEVRGGGVGESSLGCVVPDPLLPVGYDPVPDADWLELLSGKGAAELEKSVPEDDAVTLLPVASEEPGSGPPVGSEEFVIGKGVASLAVTELPTLVLVDNVTENDPETGIVDEPSTIEDVFVAVADESDEFVSGKGVAMLVALAVGIEELAKGYRLVSVELGLEPDDKGTLVSRAELLVGLTTCVEEFVSGNGTVSLALIEVRLAVGIGVVVTADPEPNVAEEPVALSELFVGLAMRVLEFANVKGIVAPALIEPVLFAENGVEMGMDSVLETDVLVILDWVFVGLDPIIVGIKLGDEGADDAVLLVTLPPVPVTEGVLLAMLPLKVVFELMLARDPGELGATEPDEGRLEALATPEDGDVKLPVKVEFVNGYRAVELDPDCCMVALLLPVVERGDMRLENPLVSDVTVAEAVPFPLMDSVAVPRVVEFPTTVVGEDVTLSAEETVPDPGKVGALVEFVKGYGIGVEIVPIPDVKPLGIRPLSLPVIEGKTVYIILVSDAILPLGLIGAVPEFTG